MSDETQSDEFGNGNHFADLGAYDDLVRVPVRSSRQVAIVAAAGILILGGVAGGFLFVSSNPGGDSASAAVPGLTTSTSSPSTAAPTTSANIPLVGKDVFVPITGNAAETTTSTGQTAAAETSVARSSTSVAANTGPSVAVSTGRTTSTSAAGGKSSAGSTKTTAPSASTTTGTVPSAIPTHSTAPTWEQPSVGFVTGTDAYGIFTVDGEQVRVAKGTLIYPLSVRYQGIVVETTATATATATATSTEDTSVLGVFTSENNSSTGWLVPSDTGAPTELPATALGTTHGQVRLGGVLRDKFWLRVDRNDDVLLAAGTAVDGTGLTFAGAVDTRVPSASAFFTDAAGIVYFGSMGEGDSDGVLY
ncbi:hypothetical protein ACFQ46_00805 [Kineococcus sp. GCM10028916]|uniref:hypothetical protein n=1 Tax=Kineococcus sp. GCM10028916 TaxID=3273394 RepID=UPI003626B5E6